MTDRADAVFAGSIPDAYDTDLVPLIFEAYAADLANLVASLDPTSVLELAAGTGVVTRSLAAALTPSTRLTASDLHASMIDTAIRRGSRRTVSWCAADASDLPFAVDSYDVVVCQFGVMFFPDRVRAFRDIARVLRPGGVLAFNVWDEIDANEFAAAVTDALAELYPDDPPDFMAAIPHGYHETSTIRRDLLAAGFSGSITIERVERTSRAATPEVAARAFCLGTPLRNDLDGRTGGDLRPVLRHTAARTFRRRRPGRPHVGARRDGAADEPVSRRVGVASGGRTPRS